MDFVVTEYLRGHRLTLASQDFFRPVITAEAAVAADASGLNGRRGQKRANLTLSVHYNRTSLLFQVFYGLLKMLF